MKFKHKDVGLELTKVEWEAVDIHIPNRRMKMKGTYRRGVRRRY